MTPGTLLAHVENNACQYRLIHREQQKTCASLAVKILLLQQDIITALHSRPQARFYYNPQSEQQVRQLLEDWEQRLALAWHRLEQAEAEVDRLSESYRPLVAEREIKLRALVREHRYSAERRQLSSQLDALRTNRERLAQSLPRLIEERDCKLQAYADNRYYVHLRERGFGEARYPRRGKLSEKLDAWLAKSINFAQNSRNEQILREMPASVETALVDHNERIARLEASDAEQWQQTLSHMAGDTSTGLRVLRAKEIAAARNKASTAEREIQALLEQSDSPLHKAASLVVDQAGTSDLSQSIASMPSRSAAEAQLFSKHGQELLALSTALAERQDRATRAAAQYTQARALEHAVYEMRARLNECPAQCTCACHGTSARTLPCPCTYTDERFYDYPASLDLAQLLASYMKLQLKPQDLIELFESQRQWLVIDVGFISATTAAPMTVSTDLPSPAPTTLLRKDTR